MISPSFTEKEHSKSCLLGASGHTGGGSESGHVHKKDPPSVHIPYRENSLTGQPV